MRDLPADATFHGVSFDCERQTARTFGAAALEAELADRSVFSWVDLQSRDIGALNEVLGALRIDLVLVSHFDAEEILPRIVERPDCLAFYLYEVEDPERHLDTRRGISEIGVVRMVLILGADFVVTYHRRPLDAVDEVKRNCEASFRLAGRTPGFVAFLFLQRCLYDYAHLNLANDNYLDVLEERVIQDQVSEVSTDISIAARNILTLAKLTTSLHIVLMLLATKRSAFVSEESRPYYRDMMQNAQSVRASVDSSRDLLDGILGGIQAAAANRTSEIARVLTIISGVLLPLSVVAGIYGMNFKNMPEIQWEWGYFAVLGLMAAIAGAQIYAFRRLGWIFRRRSEGRNRPGR